MTSVVMVTGGAGFIGSAFIRYMIKSTDSRVINIDKLTYASNPDALRSIADNPRYIFERGDICDANFIQQMLARYQPDAIIHLAAETHVDRSIDGPAPFIQTNIVGTYTLLESARGYWSALPAPRKAAFRFHQVSTDEVFGSLGMDGVFSEDSSYRPNSPYAASKASSDHLALAWHKTFGLPVVMSNCSNNYGPHQFPEKLIPLMIIRAQRGESLPIYGRGENVRDWLHVDDHAAALHLILTRGRPGQSYNVGGGGEAKNIDIVNRICSVLDGLVPRVGGACYTDLIAFVEDRPGHDFRYAIDAQKIRRELGWQPERNLADGLRETVEWYLANRAWWESVMKTRYDGGRLGRGATVN